VLSPGVRVECQASVERSILFSGVQVGAHSIIRNAIVDHNVRIPENTAIGVNPEANRAEGHTVTESGLVIVHAGSPGVSLVEPVREGRRPAASEDKPHRRTQYA
jgi:glucose-1-phosphate adenylyltransferase